MLHATMTTVPLDGYSKKVQSPQDLTDEEREYICREFIEQHRPRDLPMSLELIVQCATEAAGVQPAQIRTKGRKRECVLARQIAMALARKHTTLSLKQIGDHFGGRDHTTVIHSVNTIADLLSTKNEPACALYHEAARLLLNVQKCGENYTA